MPQPKANPEQTTWSLYKAHLARTQVSILIVCVVLYVVVRPGIIPLAITFVLLQVAAYLGVWWGLRAARRMAAKEDKLPLQD